MDFIRVNSVTIYNLCHFSVLLCLLIHFQTAHSAEVSTACDILGDICYVHNNININDGDNLRIIADDPIAIKSLYFTQNSKLGSIPFGVFKNFPNLELFDISSNGIDTLQSNRFGDAKNLQSLRLDQNYITIVPSKVFVNVASVSTIYLQYNSIENIEDYAFENMINLKTLRLDWNLIRALGRFTFAGAPHITVLQLEKNKIETIEEGALNLPHLEELNLSKNNLKIVYDSLLLAVPKLVTLSLNKNPIEDVNLTTLASLESLDVLSLSDIKLKFPFEIESLSKNKSKLRRIILEDNGFSNTDIFKRLAIFGQLEIIFANKNNFTGFDEVEKIRNYFPQLKQLSLEDNMPPLCDWIKVSQDWLNGIIVWSKSETGILCGSADFSYDWYEETFIWRNN